MPKKERATGNGIVISGTNADDLLSGLGGSYILSGGNGNDTYVVDLGDAIDEKNNGGIDLVISETDWVLDSNIENLTLDGLADSAGTGNAKDNVVAGNNGANRLYGLGGDDALNGGGGDDELFGGGGDDALTGGGGSNLLDGGDGVDVAVFGGPRSDYTIERSGTELHVSWLGGSDILRNIEFLSFGDEVIAASAFPDGDVAPQAIDDVASGLEGVSIVIAVLSNDRGNGLSVALATHGAKGLVTINDDGTVTYQPTSIGSDAFTYEIVDSLGRTSSATVSVEVSHVNGAPNPAPDDYSTTIDETFISVGSVLNNDRDPDGDELTISGYDAVSIAGGVVEMRSDGNFTYTPSPGFIGEDSFGYTVSDGNGGLAEGIVTLSVSDPDTAPIEPPYYIEDLIFPDDWTRLNWPSQIGSAMIAAYAFLTEVPGYYDWWTDEQKSSFDAFTGQQQQVTREVLARIESFTGLTFVEVAPAEAAITFGTMSFGGDGFAWNPQGSSVGTFYADVWLDAALAGDTITPGTTAFETLLHELGHALGLAHPNLPIGEDTQQYTVMTLASQPTIQGDVPDEYRLYDIAALQYLYGVNTGHASGDDVYDTSTLVDRTEVIWDGGGRDALDLSASPYAVRIDLADGSFSTAHATGQNNIAIAYGTVIEDAIGSAYNDVIMGNSSENVINGGRGDDILTGHGGGDVFNFGLHWGGDTITDFVRGADLLDLSSLSISLSDFTIDASGERTILSYGQNSITLVGVTAIDGSDFLVA